MKYKEIKGYKYQLVEDFTATLPYDFGCIDTKFVKIRGNLLRVRDGYAWDGASGPTIDTKDSMIAALVHDALYQMIKIGELDESYRILADKTFRNFLLVNGMGMVRANLWYHAVRKFGGLWLKAGKEPEIIDV